MFENRKLYLLLAFLSLFLLTSMIQDSYAKYVSSASASGNFNVARWNFKVNTQDVISKNDFTSVIEPVFTGNENIKDGVIAPTSKGYFDITIDATSVDVSYTEKITLSLNDTNSVTDLKISGYQLNDGTLTEIEGNTITVSHSLSDSKKTNTYRIYVEWVDGDGETMDNSADTNASKSGTASVKVELSFIQKAS